MIELLRYLEANGFTTFIASGGDRDFMRAVRRRRSTASRPSGSSAARTRSRTTRTSDARRLPRRARRVRRRAGQAGPDLEPHRPAPDRRRRQLERRRPDAPVRRRHRTRRCACWSSTTTPSASSTTRPAPRPRSSGRRPTAGPSSASRTTGATVFDDVDVTRRDRACRSPPSAARLRPAVVARRTSSAGSPPGAVVIPQAMAYASIADLPAEVGLYTCMVPMVVYALLGGSRTLSVSTTSTIAVLTGSTLLAAGVAAGSRRSGARPGDADAARRRDPARSPACCGSASLIDNISEATLTGIKIGVGLTVAAGQLPKLLGIAGDPTATTSSPRCGPCSTTSATISWRHARVLGGDARRAARPAPFAPRIPGPAGRGRRRHPARRDRASTRRARRRR